MGGLGQTLPRRIQRRIEPRAGEARRRRILRYVLS